ncbi:MAG: site-specific integrase [Rhodospirillales bacterium]
MTPDEAADLVRVFFREGLEKDEKERGDGRGRDPYEADQMADALECVADDWRAYLQENDMREAEDIADRFLKGRGQVVDKGTDGYRDFLRFVCRAMIEVSKIGAARTLGHYEVLPQDPLFAPVAAGRPGDQVKKGPALSNLVDQWCKETARATKTEKEFRTSIRRFIEVNGDLPVEKIGKEHVRQLKEALIQLPARSSRVERALSIPMLLTQLGEDHGRETLAPATVNKTLGAISAVLQWGVVNGYLETNAAAGVKVKDPQADRDKRLPFDDDDLRNIFRSPVFSLEERPKAGCGDAAYWLPVLALYTGARLNELGQALVVDVKKEGDTAYLDLNTEGEDKRLKTRGSKRKIPVHREVIRLEFAEYIATLDPNGRLFPDLQRDVNGTWTGNWSKWFGRYLRSTVAIGDGRKVFHSFRHTFKDACRRARIPTDVHNALTGHADGTVAANYGGAYPIEVLTEAVAKISYERLEIAPWGSAQCVEGKKVRAEQRRIGSERTVTYQ